MMAVDTDIQTWSDMVRIGSLGAEEDNCAVEFVSTLAIGSSIDVERKQRNWRMGRDQHELANRRRLTDCPGHAEITI